MDNQALAGAQDQSGAEMHMQGRDSYPNNRMITKDAAVEIRMGFVRKVYGVLSVQLLLTVVIAAPITAQGYYWAYQNQWLIYLCSISTIALMCAMVCCSQMMREFPTNYIFLLLFTAAEAVLIGVICAQYTVQSVLASVAATVLIFLAMSAYACFSKTDFTGMGPYIFAAFMCFMMFGFVLFIVSLFTALPAWLEVFYNFIGILIFTFYIVFDTQRIMGEWGGHKHQFSVDDYCFASLTLYLDILNLFLYILAIFGNRRN